VDDQGLLKHFSGRGVGVIRASRVGALSQLARTTEQVLALKQQLPELVIRPAHEPTAVERLFGSWRSERLDGRRPW
jgi:hypothetical protein